jgi:1,4-dihydroxy-6-naphthoate synthase
MGDGYGPRLVAREPMTMSDLRGKRIAIPGMLTSAYLAMRLCEPHFEAVPTPFNEVEDAVEKGVVDCGLIIHEGQLTYRDRGLHLVLDLGAWWQSETGLPLPLGGNVVRKDLGLSRIRDISRHLRASIDYALSHREDALEHAMQYSRGLARERADTFVGMYVNKWTQDYGPRGRLAITEFLDRAAAEGIIPRKVEVEFVEE